MLLLHDNASTLRRLTCLIYILQFQEIIVYKIPLFCGGGEGVYSQPKV